MFFVDKLGPDSRKEADRASTISEQMVANGIKPPPVYQEKPQQAQAAPAPRAEAPRSMPQPAAPPRAPEPARQPVAQRAAPPPPEPEPEKKKKKGWFG